jgi:hypothetical protein
MPVLRCQGGSQVTSLPPMRAAPPLGSTKPAIMRKVVVLPQPDGPSSTTNSPSATSSVTPATAA